MLFRRLGNYRGFFLDVLAIFIGITTSFWVEEMRSERQREDSLNEIIGEIRANLLIDRLRLTEILGREQECLTILSDFFADPGIDNRNRLLSDQYCPLFHLSFIGTNSSGYQRMLNSAQSYKFDESLLALDNLYNVMQIFNISSMQVSEDLFRLAKMAREKFHLREAFDLRGDESLTMPFADFQDLQRDPDFIAMLYQLRMYRTYWIKMGESLSTNIRKFLELIEKQWPDAVLPIYALSLQGDGTEAGDSTAEGWERPTPLFRNRRKPHLWQAVVNLKDGFVKFRGNDTWELNWGAPRVKASKIIQSWSAEYANPGDVFPRGRAEFGGLNIPVETKYSGRERSLPGNF